MTASSQAVADAYLDEWFESVLGPTVASNAWVSRRPSSSLPTIAAPVFTPATPLLSSSSTPNSLPALTTAANELPLAPPTASSRDAALAALCARHEEVGVGSAGVPG